jgi:hypothetical protein
MSDVGSSTMAAQNAEYCNTCCTYNTTRNEAEHPEVQRERGRIRRQAVARVQQLARKENVTLPIAGERREPHEREDDGEPAAVQRDRSAAPASADRQRRQKAP